MFHKKTKETVIYLVSLLTNLTGIFHANIILTKSINVYK